MIASRVPLVWLLAVELLATSCAAVMPGSIGSTPFCAPALAADDAGAVVWDLNGERSAMLSDAPTLRTAGRLLQGTWDVLTVATEGVNPPSVARWQLRLVATDPVARDLCEKARCSSDVGFPATGAPLDGSTSFDSTKAARGLLHGSDAVTAFFNRYTNRLQLRFGETDAGAGTLYDVTHLTDSTLTGRWSDGSFGLTEVRRGDVRTQEHLQGFFCAKRVVKH